MKICFKDLLNIADEKRYEIDIPCIEIKDNIFINGIKDIKGSIIFYYEDDNLYINYHLKGQMVCPDSLTLEDVDVPFDLNEEEIVTTKENEDGFYFVDNMDINEFVSYIVLPEVPIMVEKPNEKRYYSGDGWTILTEEEYEKRSKEEIDPRLAKLLEYKEE